MPDRTIKPDRRRPTAWIVMTAVLALVAVGLGIWGFSARADADDAQAKLEAQQQAAAAGAATQEPGEVDPELQQRYEELKTQLGVTGENLDQLDEQLDQAVANASDKAEQAQTDAGNAIERATAEVEAIKARASVTKTCFRGTLDALGAAFSAGGLEAAVTELETLSSGCRSSASP